MRDHGLEARPPQAPPRFDPRPRELEAWLSALPMANIGETARRLYGALRESNAQDLPHRQRLHLLESLRPVLEHVRSGLRKHYLDTAFPLPRRAEQVAALSRELCLQMASGYRVVLAGLPQRRLFAERATATLACHRALALMGQALLPCYQTYAAPPSTFWRLLHGLYEDARARRLETRIIDGGEDGPTQVATEYKRALLFALAAPHRLRQGELSALHRQLARWAEHARLRPAEEAAAAGEYGFAVPCTGDAAPQHLSRRGEAAQQARIRVLDTRDLAEEVRRLLAGQAGALIECAPGRRLGRDMLRRLLASWGAPLRRGFPRTQRDEGVEVAVGLSAVHHLLLEETGEAGELVFEDRPAQYRSAGVKSVNDTAPDVWDVHYHGPPPGGVDAAAEPPPAAPARRTYVWRSLNVSPGGWALRLQSDGVRVQVGELLGMRPQNSAAPVPWSAGVVRWIRRRGGPAVELGVELIEREPLAIGARVRRTPQDRGTRMQRALLLPGDGSAAEVSLLLPALSGRESESIEACGSRGGFSLRLGAALEHSGGFSRYRIAPPLQPADDAGFAALWTEL